MLQLHLQEQDHGTSHIHDGTSSTITVTADSTSPYTIDLMVSMGLMLLQHVV